MKKPAGYNYELVDRVFGLLKDIYMPNWDNELAEMNRGKSGRPYRYPDGLILSLAKVKAVLKLTYRDTMAQLKSLLPDRCADYTTIYRRICNLHVDVPRIKPGMKIVFAVDSTGLRVGHGGEWLRAKHGEGNKRAFIKFHIGIDLGTGMIESCVITEDTVHDSQCLKELVEQAERSCEIDEVLADGGYDTNGVFQMLDDKDIKSTIKVRVNSRSDTGCRARQLVVKAQVGRYAKWNKDTGYGRRTSVERVFAVFKKIFGEAVQARKVENIIQEILIKVLVYNQFVAMRV